MLKVTSQFLKHLQNRLHFRLFIQMEEIFISSSSEIGELNEIHDGIYFDYWNKTTFVIWLFFAVGLVYQIRLHLSGIMYGSFSKHENMQKKSKCRS